MIKCKSPKESFKLHYFLLFISGMGGSVVEQKNMMAKIAGSSPDKTFILQENV